MSNATVEKRPVSYFCSSLLSKLASIFYEKGFKIHLVLYWLLLLAQLLFVRSHHHSPIFFILSLLASEPIVFGMVAATTKTALFLLPLMVTAFLEFSTYLLASIYYFTRDEVNIPQVEDWLRPPADKEGQIVNTIICILMAIYFLFLTISSSNVFLFYRGEAKDRAKLLDSPRNSSSSSLEIV